MNKNFTPYIYILFFLASIHGIFAQDFTLKLIGKDSLETDILNRVSYKQNLQNEKEVFNEINHVIEKVKRLGYFTSKMTGIENEKKLFVAKISLGEKIENAIIIINDSIRSKYQNYFFSSKDSLELKTREIETFIQSIIKTLDQEGESFSEIQLKNPKLKNKTIFLDLTIQSSVKRTIDKVIVKGYEEFPESYIKRYYKINKKQTFSKDKLKTISQQTKSLGFSEEIKPPEVLFKQDSTILYLFLKRIKTSSVDGILNFASNEDGSGLLINGNLDLKLNNVLNTGERFELYWNRVKEENSEFRIGATIPYIFGSAFSSSVDFNIYRQDSTFLNTTFRSRLEYQANSKSQIFISYTSENSDYLIDSSQSGFDSYASSFIGIGYRFSTNSNSPLYSHSFSTELAPSYGNRKNALSKINQLKLRLFVEANISINNKSYFNIKNNTGVLESENFLTNELFRIGGANSIRGFNEQSIFTNRYSYINLEYRYLTSLTSYLHTITDFGFHKDQVQNSTNTLLGLGLGYLFQIDNNQINLGYAVGLSPNDNLNLNNSKFIIKWTSSF